MAFRPVQNTGFRQVSTQTLSQPQQPKIPNPYINPIQTLSDAIPRIKSAATAGLENIKGGAERFKGGIKDVTGTFKEEDFTKGGRTGESRDISDRVAQFSWGLSKLGGGAGQVALTPFAAGIGAVQPELESSIKGYQEAFKLLPPDTQEKVKTSAKAIVDAVPEDVKEGTGNILYSLGLLSVPAQLRILKQTKNVVSPAVGTKAKATLTPKQINAAVEQGKVSATKGKELIKAGKEAQARGLATRPMEVTGKRLNTAVQDVNTRINTVGKQIGAKARQLGGDKATINTKATLKNFRKDLFGKNVRIDKKGTLDFSKSDLKGLSSTGKNTLQEQYNLYRKTGLTARELLANNRDLGHRLYAGSKEASFRGAEGILNNIRTGSVKAMNKQYPATVKLNAEYSELVKGIDEINRLAGASGIKSPQVLRRIFGQAAGQSKEAVLNLERLSKKYNIKSGLNLAKEAEFALEAEQALGVLPTSGLASQVGTTIPTSKVHAALKILEGLKGKVLGTKGKVLGTPEANLLKILKNPTGYTKPTIANKVLKALEQPIGKPVNPAIIKSLSKVVKDKKGAARFNEPIKKTTKNIAKKQKDIEGLERLLDRELSNSQLDLVNQQITLIKNKKPSFKISELLERELGNSQLDLVDQYVKLKMSLQKPFKLADLTAKPKAQTNLLKEAKKYKSADEFVSTFNKKYHQTGADAAKSIEKKGFKFDFQKAGANDPLPLGVNTKSSNAKIRLPNSSNQIGVHFDKNLKSLSFSNRKNAESYFYNHKKGSVYKKAIDKANKIDDLYESKLDIVEGKMDTRYKEIYKKGISAGDDITYQKLVKESKDVLREWEGVVNKQYRIAKGASTKILKDEGVEVFNILEDTGAFGKLTDNTIILNPSNIKTTSQLKDIWKQAN